MKKTCADNFKRQQGVPKLLTGSVHSKDHNAFYKNPPSLNRGSGRNSRLQLVFFVSAVAVALCVSAYMP